MSSTLTFLGAARTVTGSRYLVEAAGRRVLVDCGMFQGLKELRLRNWADSPVPPATIDAVVLTHAHLDHCGMLPRLVAQGFKGRIFCTPGTQDLCSLVLPDAGRLQEEEAERANRKGYSKHRPAKPLFTEEQAMVTLSRLQPVGYERPIPMYQRARGGVHTHGPPARRGLRAHAPRRRQRRHGDLRRRPGPLQPADPARPRRRLDGRRAARRIDLRRSRARRRATSRSGWRQSSTTPPQKQGKLIIPAFAIGRVEEVLYAIKQLEDAREGARRCRSTSTARWRCKR